MIVASEAVVSSADSELQRRVVNFLFARSRPALRHLKVTADNGTVTVSGRVRSFHEKQLALHCCTRVAGVVRLIDSVDVED